MVKDSTAPKNVARSIPALLVATGGSLTPAPLLFFRGRPQRVGLANCGVELKFIVQVLCFDRRRQLFRRQLLPGVSSHFV